jgi:hypothetical protein
MAEQSRTDLFAVVLDKVPDNTTRLITPQKVREVLAALIESGFNLTDDADRLSTEVADGGVTFAKLASTLLSADVDTGEADRLATAEVIKTYVLGRGYATTTELAAAVNGIKWKASVRGVVQDVAGPSAPTLSGTYTTIDGVALIAGDRVIVNSSVNATLNGIYVVAAGAWSRSADAATGASLKGAAAAVEEGTTFGDKVLLVSNNGTITIGSTNITWVMIAQATAYAAGDGLGLSGVTFAVDSTVMRRTVTPGTQSGSSINLDTAIQTRATAGGTPETITITSFTNTGIGKSIKLILTSANATDAFSFSVAGATITQVGFNFVPGVVNYVDVQQVAASTYLVAINPIV